jgi:hypothetical protein
MSTLKTISIQHLNGSSPSINLDSSGNVGVGISSPGARLDVKGGAGDNGTINITNNSGNIWKFWNDLGSSGMNIQYNGTTRMVIDSSGRVTTPYQPAFRAYSSAGSYSTTNTDIAFPSTDFNIGNHYNTSNGRFTAPVSGVYHIIWSMSSFGAASCSLDLFLNGNSQQYSEQNNSLTYFVTGQSQLRYLSGGDYVTLRLRFGTINLSYPSTNFQAFLVG